MGTKAQEERNGCWAKAMDGEVMFILLARDIGAPALVRAWADERMEQITAGMRPKADLEQVQEAYQCATRMEAWRETHDGEWRLPPGQATGELNLEPNVMHTIRPSEPSDSISQWSTPGMVGNDFIDKLNEWCSHAESEGSTHTAIPTEALRRFINYDFGPGVGTDGRGYMRIDKDGRGISQADLDQRDRFPTIDPNRRRGAEPVHTVRREGDEWACRCGARWPIVEGYNHPRPGA